jgi:hypothetical protein
MVSDVANQTARVPAPSHRRRRGRSAPVCWSCESWTTRRRRGSYSRDHSTAQGCRVAAHPWVPGSPGMHSERVRQGLPPN